MISLFDLISISLILSDVRHFSYVYWSFLWRNVIEAFYTFFKLSYLPAVVLKLSCNTILYILDLVPCSKFADTSSHSIGCLSIDVEETILFFICFNWRLITLQYCGGFCHTLTWISHGCTCVPRLEPPFNIPPHPIPQDHPSAPALSTLSHTSNLDWWSISHMIIYMFQCYSLKSSHPHLLPQSPKVYSLHLCLFGYLVYKVIITTFLNSTYMC